MSAFFPNWRIAMCNPNAVHSVVQPTLKPNQKPMKPACKIIVAAVISTASLTLHAQVISWSFDQYGFGNANGGSGVPVPNTSAGVVSAYNWNDSWSENYSAYASGTPVTVNNLFDNSGTATTLGLSYNSYNGYYLQNSHPAQDADGSYNRQMLNGFLNAGPATWNPPVTQDTISLTNIPYAQYDIYVYVSDDTAGRIANVSNGLLTYDLSAMGAAAISGANASLIQSTDTTGANPTADYVVFSGLSGSTQTITVSPGDTNPSDSAWVGLAAFQIVAVPEPGTMALAGLGGAALLVLASRKKLSAHRPPSNR